MPKKLDIPDPTFSGHNLDERGLRRREAGARLMGRGKPRLRRVHAAFPGEGGLIGSGLICGRPRAGSVIAVDPARVTCQTCLIYVRAHPEEFPALRG